MVDSRAVRWVPFSNQLNVGELGATPVEGGKEANGALLYVARVKYNDGIHPAKIGEHLPAAHLAFNGTEVLVEVRILFMSDSCDLDGLDHRTTKCCASTNGGVLVGTSLKLCDYCPVLLAV